MDTQHFTDLAKRRLSVAKEYLDKLKEKMGDDLLYAYIYGSTAKNCPREDSDIDLILVARKPSPEERVFINSPAGGLFDNDRGGSINFAHNSHYLFRIQDELRTKYNIDISPYYHYEEEGNERKLRSHVRSMTEILSEPHLLWPRDFESIAYL